MPNKKFDVESVYKELVGKLGREEAERRIEEIRRSLERRIGWTVSREDAILTLMDEIGKKERKAEEERILKDLLEKFIVVTTPTVPGYEIVKIIGPVYGLTVRSRGLGGRVAASLETLVGGEITSYVEECKKARDESLVRLIRNAEEYGANAIIGVDFETSDILTGIATLFSAYGTAVVVKPIEDKKNNIE